MQIKPCTQCFLSYIIISPFLSFVLGIQAACISAAVTDNASQKKIDFQWLPEFFFSSGSSPLLEGLLQEENYCFGGGRQSQCHDGLSAILAANSDCNKSG